jgi:hypothetical protein
MEQIQQLLEVLKQTPTLALWGLGMFFLFTLLKLASWVGSLTLIAKLFINRYFDNQKEIQAQKRAHSFNRLFEDSVMAETDKIKKLLRIIGKNSGLISTYNIDQAIEKLNK